MSLAAGRILLHCREQIALLLDVPDPEQILFCFNCTDALNLAIRGCLRPGDHVVTTLLEHNSTLRPLHGAVERGLITWTLPTP
ncbi:MAG TPA: aminotransferase class V-fold PLP-dependent enzyme, partial [Clostridia bacterium]|nr:aminotransferase class V-fold PLP-dependent enzyme [Clostridia bacterium]